MMNRLKKIKLKAIVKFIAWFFATYFVIEFIENLLGIENMETTGVGLFIFVIIYLFKFHIACCLVPFLVATYRCKHKKCHHDHCEPETQLTLSPESVASFTTELEMIFKYKNPIITWIGTGFYVRITRPASGNKERFNEFLHSQSEIFKYMELQSYWTDGNNVIFTTKICKPGK